MRLTTNLAEKYSFLGIQKGLILRPQILKYASNQKPHRLGTRLAS